MAIDSYEQQSPDYRKKAREIYQRTKPDDSYLRIQDKDKLIEELRIYQIELELQNEELRDAQYELESLRKKYRDLYEYAPVVYITCDIDGFILELNSTAAFFFNLNKKEIIGKNISKLIAPGSQDVYYFLMQKTNGEKGKATAEIAFVDSDGKIKNTKIAAAYFEPENHTNAEIRFNAVEVTNQ